MLFSLILYRSTNSLSQMLQYDSLVTLVTFVMDSVTFAGATEEDFDKISRFLEEECFFFL